jgi:hypothetical protein
MDVFISSFPIDNEMHIVSKSPTILGVPDEIEHQKFDMDSAMLS